MRGLVLAAVMGVAAGCSSSTADNAADATPVPAATAAPDTSPAETATPDTATPDTAAPDTAAPDTATDTAPADTAPVDTAPADTAPADTIGTATSVVVGPADRPVTLFVPSGYDPAHPAPLVVLLHGYTASGDLQEAYFQVRAEAEARGYLYLHPDGTIDAIGNRFWNATDACCDFVDTGVDDVGYIEGLVAEVSEQYAVDPDRVYLLGHSNGGFMSYRMACEEAETFAAIVSLAGATYVERDDCSPAEPVSVVQIHGTADAVVAYEGGVLYDAAHPAATDTAALWAGYDGCTGEPVAEPGSLDLVADLPGAETSVSAYRDCAAGTAVELWTIADGSHVPAVGPGFLPAVFDFFEAHPKA